MSQIDKTDICACGICRDDCTYHKPQGELYGIVRTTDGARLEGMRVDTAFLRECPKDVYYIFTGTMPCYSFKITL